MTKFNPGEKVLIEAVILRYVDNDVTAPKPYYQVGLPNGISIVLCDQVHSMKVLTNPEPKIIQSEEYKEKHYRETKKET